MYENERVILLNTQFSLGSSVSCLILVKLLVIRFDFIDSDCTFIFLIFIIIKYVIRYVLHCNMHTYV